MTKFVSHAIGLGSIIAIAALPASGAADDIAAVGERPNLPSIEVPYGDLDLTGPAGVEKLTSRVRAAARRVCDLRSDRVSIEETMVARDCFRRSFAQAENDIHLTVATVRDGTAIAGLRTIKVASR
ncbi:MAG: UrcA family protein [Erythrobacter sp.]|jgi:UrcA family protein